MDLSAEVFDIVSKLALLVVECQRLSVSTLRITVVEFTFTTRVWKKKYYQPYIDHYYLSIFFE